MNFGDSLGLTLKFEGGYVDDPDDLGGATNQGVTQKTYDEWRSQKNQPTRPVKELTEAERDAIYYGFWRDNSCDQLQSPLNCVHFDAAVNHGGGRAAKMLQETVGAEVDGKVGPITIGLARGVDPAQAANDYLWLRVRWYRRIAQKRPANRKFLLGWLGRILHLRSAVT
jgi:lysozyme family protein